MLIFAVVVIAVSFVSEKINEHIEFERQKHQAEQIKVGYEYVQDGYCYRLRNCYLDQESFLARKPDLCGFRISCENRKICGMETECKN